MTGGTPAEIAEAYTEALESRADGDEYEAAKERRDELKERLERFKDTYGDSDPLTLELSEKVESAESEVAEIEQQRREPEELKRDLLDAATGFMLDDDWLQPNVIEAFNRALTGEPHPTIRVKDVELAGTGDAEALDDIDRYDIIDAVRKIALDSLGEADDLEHVWRTIEGTTKEDAFRVVAETGRADPDDVMDEVDEDIGRSAARNRLKNAVYETDISPYHREDGTYALSTAGRYIASEYLEAPVTDDQEPGNGGRGDDGQMVLGEEVAAAKGGGGDE